MTEPARTDVAPGDRFIEVDGVRLHYLDVGHGAPPLLLLHGLSANAQSFGGVIAAGLGDSFRLIVPDLRGRGQSAAPATGYSMEDHARDAVALLDALGLDRVAVVGHSFGGFLGIYLAATRPERVTKLVVIDAAMTLNPRVGEMLKPSLDRLTRTYPSADAYLAEVRGAPYMDHAWDAAIEGYFRAEIRENADGTVASSTSAGAIAQALQSVVSEHWGDLVPRVTQPVLLLNALGPYGPPGSPPLVEADYARETARAFPRCRYTTVPGNHLTMMFTPGAAAVTREITSFVRE